MKWADEKQIEAWAQEGRETKVWDRLQHILDKMTGRPLSISIGTVVSIANEIATARYDLYYAGSPLSEEISKATGALLEKMVEFTR